MIAPSSSIQDTPCAPVQPKKKAFWTIEETEAVALATARLMWKQGLGTIPTPNDRTGRSMLVQFIRTAQIEVLKDKSRRRLAASAAAYKPTFYKLLQHALDALKDEAARQAAAKDAQQKEAPKVETPPPEALPAAPQPGNRLVHLIHLVAGELAQAAEQATARAAAAEELQQFAELLTQELGDLREQNKDLHRRLAALENREANGSHRADKKVLPRVAVLGCRKYEFDFIVQGARAAGIEADFRHYDQDTKPHPFAAEYAVALKFVTHAWEAQARNAIADRQKYFFTNGGIKTVVNQLREWFLK